MTLRTRAPMLTSAAFCGALVLACENRIAFAQDATPSAPPPGATPPPIAVAPPPDDGGRSAKNALFVEGGGNGAYYSINYERFVSDDVSLRMGFSYIGWSASWNGRQTSTGSVITIPVLANYYLGSLNHKLQLGLGATFVNGSEQDAGAPNGSTFNDGGSFIAVGTGVVGYRYIPANGGFTFGIGFTPFFTSLGVFPWAALSLGAVF